MIKFTQDNINALTDYILSNEAARILSTKEDWYNLFHLLYRDEYYIVTKILRPASGVLTSSGFIGFLYEYFRELDNFNILDHIFVLPLNSFKGTEIEEITIPGNIKEIGSEAFAFSNVKKVTLEEGIESVSAAAFYNCTNLVSINLPRSLEYIGREAFEFCSSLTDINYNGKSNQWAMIQKDRPILSVFSPTNSIECKLKCTDGEFQIN